MQDTTNPREQVRYVTLLGATGQIRTASHDGREHLVVPVVALVEGVIHPVNAPTPELVRAAQFTPSLPSWNGRPVFAGHPMRNGAPVSGNLPDVLETSLGRVFNARSEGSRLLMEAWIDPTRVKPRTPAESVLERLRRNEMVEVSVGVFVDAEQVTGDWKGRKYKAEWKSIQPDHLALLLEGQTGACSIAMGCGTPRVAMQVKWDDVGADGTATIQYTALGDVLVTPAMRALLPRGWGDDEVRADVTRGLRLIDPDFLYGDVIRVQNDRVIYATYPPPPATYDLDAPPAMPAEPSYWSRGFSFDTATQAFQFDSTRMQVEPTTVYAPVHKAAAGADNQSEPTELNLKAACGCGGTPNNNPATSATGGDTMKEQRIAALVANPHNPVKCPKALDVLSDEALTELEAFVTAAKASAEEATQTAEALKAAQARITALEAPKSEEEWLKTAPQSIRDLVARDKAAETELRNKLVGDLKAAQSAFTEEELNAKTTEELRKLTDLAKIVKPEPVVDFAGRGVPRNNTTGENFAPPDPFADALKTLAKV